MTDLSVDRATLPDTRVPLLEAAEAALRLLDRIDAHAPEGLHFGGEGKVRKQLRQAIREAESADEAKAVYEEELASGRAMSERERAAFLNGFREAQWEHTTRV